MHPQGSSSMSRSNNSGTGRAPGESELRDLLLDTIPQESPTKRKTQQKETHATTFAGPQTWSAFYKKGASPESLHGTSPPGRPSRKRENHEDKIYEEKIKVKMKR